MPVDLDYALEAAGRGELPADSDVTWMTSALLAIFGLVRRCEKISPNAVIEVALVREALDTGRVPDMPKLRQ